MICAEEIFCPKEMDCPEEIVSPEEVIEEDVSKIFCPDDEVCSEEDTVDAVIATATVAVETNNSTLRCVMCHESHCHIKNNVTHIYRRYSVKKNSKLVA